MGEPVVIEFDFKMRTEHYLSGMGGGFTLPQSGPL